MDIKNQLKTVLGILALGFFVSGHAANNYTTETYTPSNEEVPNPVLENNYQPNLGPSEAGIQANEEESPDNTSSLPQPKNVGPAEEDIMNENEESYSDPY